MVRSVPAYERPTVGEILSVVPELTPLGRPAVLIEPEPGTPGVHDSSLGGPQLWPWEEPWPHCSVPDEEDESGLPPVSMVPVLQLFAADAPGPWWPAGRDLLQIVWCPNRHWEPPRHQAPGSPAVELRWRRAADIHDILEDPPPPVRTDDMDSSVLTPCTLRYEPIVDFPDVADTPDTLKPRLNRLIQQTGGDGKDVITRLSGWKVGGWPTWHLTGQSTEFPCDICGVAMPLLFTVASDDEVGTTVGRWGDLRIFVCRTHPHRFKADLH